MKISMEIKNLKDLLFLLFNFFSYFFSIMKCARELFTFSRKMPHKNLITTNQKSSYHSFFFEILF